MSWLDALGWAGSALLIYSLLQARVLRFRVLNLVACACSWSSTRSSASGRWSR